MPVDHGATPTAPDSFPTVAHAAGATEQRDTQTHVGVRDETIEAARPALPRPFGSRYDLVRLLGQGGMGEVYLANDKLLGRTVALKLPKLAPDRPAQRERFLREARASAPLAHPNICPVHDVGEEDGRPYLTMAYVEGIALSARLRAEGPLPPREAARLVGGIALAMKHAHTQGVLHRDLKPGNVLVNAEGEPIVMDFGLAFRFDAPTGERLTEQGLIIGTPAYMAPEQINGQALDPAADVYSLGVVLFELLTGRVPFEGALGKVLAQIESASPPRPSRLRPGLDPVLEAICLKAIAKDPADRYPDMLALATALGDYIEGRAGDAPTQYLPRPRRRWQLAAAVGGVAAAATIVVAVVLWPRDEPSADDPRPALPPQMLAAGKKTVAEMTAEERRVADLQQLFAGLARPVRKVEVLLDPLQTHRLSRSTLPQAIFKGHDGPLYFMLSGTGPGHVIDLTDQPGQGGQLMRFNAGDVTVLGSYLFFISSIGDAARVHVKGGPGLSLLAPMNGGPGCKHAEFDGTHLLMPKIGDPKIEFEDVTPAEKATLRFPQLTKKVRVRYTETEHVIFAPADIKIVPGDHTIRQRDFPDVHLLIEADRIRQMNARMITHTEVQRARQPGNEP